MNGIAMAIVLQRYYKLKYTDHMSFEGLWKFLTGSASFRKDL